MAVESPQFPAGTMLPIYSADIDPADRGRIIESGGSFTSTNTRQFVDWRNTAGGRSYPKGDALLRLWVAPSSAAAAGNYTLAGQLYRGSGTTRSPITVVSNPTGSLSDSCWQEVYLKLTLTSKHDLSANEFLGLRLWSAGASVRVAYDVAND